jgi:hypothetical protein
MGYFSNFMAFQYVFFSSNPAQQGWMILISDCAPVYLEMIRQAKNITRRKGKHKSSFKISFYSPIEHGLPVLPGDSSATCHPTTSEDSGMGVRSNPSDNGLPLLTTGAASPAH